MLVAAPSHRGDIAKYPLGSKINPGGEPPIEGELSSWQGCLSNTGSCDVLLHVAAGGWMLCISMSSIWLPSSNLQICGVCFSPWGVGVNETQVLGSPVGPERTLVARTTFQSLLVCVCTGVCPVGYPDTSAPIYCVLFLRCFSLCLSQLAPPTAALH